MKLKKILSMVVTLALVFSMVTISSVQAAEDDLAILSALGINYDFSDDTTPITRIQLAEIALALTGDLPDADGEPVYPDVPAKHKYFPTVNAVTEAGLMGPLADGSFGVNTKATGMDAGRVILAELGYSAFAKQANWTDAQYNSKVQGLNLLKGVNTSDGLTAKEAGKMIVSMLTTKGLEIDSVSSEGITFKESNLTYIESRFGYVLRVGEMQANGKASKTGFAQVGTNQAVIDGVVYNTDGRSYTDHVGSYVKYVLTSPFADGRLIHAEKYKPTEKLEIEAEDIVNYTHYSLTYTDAEGKQDVVNFSSSTRVIINGQNMTSYDARFFTPDHGKIIFTDTDGDEVFDVVNIETKVYYKIGGASMDKLSDQWSLDVINVADYEAFYSYNDGIGAELMSFEQGAYAEISAGAVEFVTVKGNEIMKPDYANSDIITVNVVPTTTVSGAITGRRANSLMIDGVAYELNGYYEDLIASGYVKSVALGSKIDAVVNEKGQIIDILNIVTDYTEVSESLTYGYMISMNRDRKSDDGAVLRIIDFYNMEDLSLQTSADCRINGKKFSFTEVEAVDPTTTSASIYWPDGSSKHQLIKYSLDRDGKVNNIYLFKDNANQFLMTGYIGFSTTHRNPDYDPAYLGYNTSEFTIDRAGNDMVADNQYLENLYSVKQAHTIQLKIPADPTQLTQWTVKLNARNSSGGTDTFFKPFYNTTTNRNNFEVYDVSEDYSIGVLIERGTGSSGLGMESGSFTDTTRSIVVSEVEDIYDEVSGEERRQVTGYQTTPSGIIKVSYIATRNDLSSTIHYTDNIGGGSYPSMLWTDVEPGDIIRVVKNTAGEVGGFGLFVDKDYISDLDNIDFGRVTTCPSHANYCNYTLGYVTAVYGEVEGAMMNDEGPTGGFSGLFKVGQPKPKAGGNQQPGAGMIWDLSAKKATFATCADLKVGDILLVHKGSGDVLEFFAFRP